MSKSDAFENDLLKLVFWGTPIAGLADNAATSPLSNLYLALHTADPGEAGSELTNEAAYTGYARAAVPRTSSGFAISGSTASLASAVNFPAGTGGSGTATHFSIGTAASGAGKILYSGLLGNPITLGVGVTPGLTSGTNVTED